MQWYVYSDGHQEPGNINYLRPERTEEEVKKSMERMISFESMTRDDLLGLTQCFEAKEEDYESAGEGAISGAWREFTGEFNRTGR
jgi:hypothetical protein